MEAEGDGAVPEGHASCDHASYDHDMPSAVPGQPLPPPAPDDPHWPLAADPTPPFVPTFEPSDFDDLDAPGWVNSPSSGGRAEHLDDTGERAVADGDRDALSSAQAQADRQARDRLISAVKVFVGIFLPGMLLVLGIGFLVKSVSGSSSDSNQDAAPASANSSPVAAQATSGCCAPVAPRVAALASSATSRCCG